MQVQKYNWSKLQAKHKNGSNSLIEKEIWWNSSQKSFRGVTKVALIHTGSKSSDAYKQRTNERVMDSIYNQCTNVSFLSKIEFLICCCLRLVDAETHYAIYG
jgi:hypothetical protein